MSCFVTGTIVKIALVQLPFRDYYTTSIRTYPLGLLYLASAIRDECDVCLIDCRTGKPSTVVFDEGDTDFAPYYNPHLFSPFRLFRHYHHFGMHDEQLIDVFSKTAADVFYFSLMFSAYASYQLSLIQKIKKWKPDAIIIVGGIHATLYPRHCLEVADYVIRGDGEVPLACLVNNLKRGRAVSNFQGICLREGENILITRPFILSDFSLVPHRKLVHHGDYFMSRKPSAFYHWNAGAASY